MMVRAFGDEPVRLLVKDHWGQAAELEFEQDGGTVVFPAADVYEFDEERFEKLCGAFRAGNAASVRRLWDGAAVYYTATESKG